MNKAFFMPYDPNHPGFLCAQVEYGSLGGAEMDKLQKDIDFDVVADRLIASGLPKTFSGKIKLFNCHSAESGAPGSDPECVGPPFARQVADELYSRGYKHCTYFGYVGSIDSFAKDGSEGKHHYIRKNVLGKQTEVARASDGRIQFHPTVKIRTPNIFQRLFG